MKVTIEINDKLYQNICENTDGMYEGKMYALIREGVSAKEKSEPLDSNSRQYRKPPGKQK